MVEQSQQFGIKSTFLLKVLMFTSPSWMKKKKIHKNSRQEMQERQRSPLNGRGYKEQNTNDLHCFLGSAFLSFWEWFAVYSILGSQLAADISCHLFLFSFFFVLPFFSVLSFFFVVFFLFYHFENSNDSVFFGPQSDHWLCLSLTHSLTHSLLFCKLYLCDVWLVKMPTQNLLS